MWRAFFLAMGICLCILGAECMAVQTFEMAPDETPVNPTAPATLFGTPPPEVSYIEPAEWAPWSFLSAGTVIILYAMTVNRSG